MLNFQEFVNVPDLPNRCLAGELVDGKDLKLFLKLKYVQKKILPENSKFFKAIRVLRKFTLVALLNQILQHTNKLFFN